MKLNKREVQAITALEQIIDAIKNNQPVHLYATDANAIKEVLNIDLKNITFRKNQIKQFVCGKDGFKIIFIKPFSAWSKENSINSYGYFLFQIKDFKPF